MTPPSAAPPRGAPGGPPRAARRLAAALVPWVIRRDTAILVGTGILTLLSSLSFLWLRLDVDLVSMLPRGRPRFADYQTFVGRFGAQDVAVALIRAPDRARAIRFGEAFAAHLERSPEVAAVRSRIDVAAFRRALDASVLPRLLPVEAHAEVARRLEPAAIERAVHTLRGVLAVPGAVGTAAAIAADPLGLTVLLAESLESARPDATIAPGREHLLTPDGRRMLVLFRPAADGYDLEASERLAADLAAAEDAARTEVADDAVEVAYTGAFAHAREDAARMKRDIALYTGLALVSVLAVFLLGYRDLRIVPFVTVQLVATSLVTFALGVLFAEGLNAMSLAFAAIFYGLSIDALIHVYTRFLEERAAGRDLVAALEETVASTLAPVTMASLTTALAFAVIGQSELAGVAQLGHLTALGMVLNIAATMVLLPASIVWLDRRVGFFQAVPDLPQATWLAWLARVAERRRAAARAAAALLVAVCALLARHAVLDTDLFHLRPSDTRAAAVDAELAREFGFADPHGAVLVLATQHGPAAREAVLRTTEAVAAALADLRAAGDVTSIHGPAALLPSRATQEERLRSWAALPRERAADELERRLVAAGFRIEPFAAALAGLRSVPEPVDPLAHPLPGLELVFERYVSEPEGRVGVLTAFAPRDRAALERVAAALPAAVDVPPGVALRVTGRPLMEAELHRTMSWELFEFTAVVLLGSGLILLVRESVRSTLAILAVPAGSIVLVGGVAAALGIDFDPVNLIVLPLMVGIGVDNCLFLAERRRELGDTSAAVAQTGRALAIVTATTVVGFGALAVSRYPALADLGRLAALGLTICFFATFVFLPVLLPRSTPRPGPARPAARSEAPS